MNAKKIWVPVPLTWLNALAPDLGLVLGDRRLTHLAFANDISLVSESHGDIEKLLTVVESWSTDYSMSISYGKSKVISSMDDAVWPVMNTEGGVSGDLEVVEYCKYLWVEMSPLPVSVSNKKGEVMISCLHKFKEICQWFLRYGPDKTTLALAVWNSRAMASLLFGVESIVLDDKMMEKLETIQISFAKSVLGVRQSQSTANAFGLVELGLKPVRQRIYECKICFFDWLRSLPSSRLAYQALVENQSESWISDYMTDITRIERETGLVTEVDIRARRLLLDSWGRKKLKSAIISKSSLNALPLPKQGWKKCSYVCDEKWSRAISMFRDGNAELGNHDSDLGSMDPDCANEEGVMINCGLCGLGSVLFAYDVSLLSPYIMLCCVNFITTSSYAPLFYFGSVLVVLVLFSCTNARVLRWS